MRVLPHARARRTAIAARLAAAAAAISLTAAACGAAPAGDPAAVSSAPAGAEAQGGTVIRLDRPLPKPELTLTDERGRPFDLVKETAGRPTLLFFGYTHCPDVCPTTMADITNAVRKLPEADRERLRVVFVTSDPARDTPKRLREWLASFDSRFTGLTGDFGDIQRAARALGIALEKPVETGGDYEVTHGGQVVAFSPADDKVHMIFTSGTTSEQFAAGLPKLVGEGA